MRVSVLQKHEQWSRRWELADLESASLGSARLYAASSVRQRVVERLDLPLIAGLEAIPADVETLLVAAGGTVIDYAKYLRVAQRPRLRLIAIPSIWGSGAEVSPIAVLNGKRKEFHCSDTLIPDRYVIWPELVHSCPPDLLRYACGDVWAHALEAFCSPLASDAIRAQAAELMNEIAAYPLGFDSRWFDASASACLLQARSSVGLIHGCAHVLESLLRVTDPAGHWGHAKLCSTFLMPVLSFNLSRSPKVKTLAAQFGLNLDAVRAVAQMLFKETDYVSAVAVAKEHWESISRDRCSRMNCVLVRRGSVAFFEEFVGAGVNA